MATVTLTALRARARERADMVNSGFVTDTADSLDRLINSAAQRLHAIIVQKFGNDYIVKSSTFNTVAGTSSYNLPSDFFKLLGVDLTIGSAPSNLKKFEFRERNVYRAATVSAFGNSLPRYRLEGSILRLYPAPNAAYLGTFWYIPQLQVNGGSTNLLVNGADTVNFDNGWEAFIEFDAAAQMLIKEESDPSAMIAERTKIEHDIEVTAENRDAGAPECAVDVEMSDVDPFGWY
jgi:hypothetical protein